MKYLLFFLSLGILVSCDNDLILNAAYKDIPIVYGLIGLSGEHQYIRLERAFLDENIPPEDVALIPDSFYYKDAIVQLRKVNSEQVFELNKINGNNFGLPRDTGIFAQDPNTLYAIATDQLNLKAGDLVELIIDRKNNLPLITAQTQIVDSVLISLPATRVNFDYLNNFTIQWFPKSSNFEPAVYNAGFDIHYREIDLNESDPKWVEHSIFWSVAKNTEETRIQKTGKEFYVFIANNFSEAPNVRREILSLDVVIDSGGEEILDYARVGEANLGLTSSQEIPFYTNLSEGRGIFSSRNQNTRHRILLSSVTQDSLSNGQFTKSLGFIN